MKRLLCWLLLAAGLLSGCGETPAFEHLTIAVGAEGSAYEQIAQAVRGGPMPIRLLSTSDAQQTLHAVAERTADAGFAPADLAILAVQGESPFDRAIPVQALAGLAEQYLQILVLKDSPVKDYAGLDKKKVVVGPFGQPSLAVHRLLNNAKIGANQLFMPLTEASLALRKGDVDAVVMTGELRRFDFGVPVRPLPISLNIKELQDSYGEVYLPRTIPATLYSTDTAIATIGIPNVLVVRSDLSEKAAYQLTALLFKTNPRLDRRVATAVLKVPLHPGAMHYYQDSKPFSGT